VHGYARRQEWRVSRVAGPTGPPAGLGNRPTPVNGCPQRSVLRTTRLGSNASGHRSAVRAEDCGRSTKTRPLANVGPVVRTRPATGKSIVARHVTRFWTACTRDTWLSSLRTDQPRTPDRFSRRHPLAAAASVVAPPKCWDKRGRRHRSGVAPSISAQPRWDIPASGPPSIALWARRRP
jgi:hypothetical protein